MSVTHHIQGIRRPAGKEKERCREFILVAAVFILSFCPLRSAWSQCPPGEADLSAAIAFGQSWLGKPYAIGGGHPNPPNPSPDAGYLGCNASTSGDPGWEYCKPGVPSYDCSGLAGAIGAQISGYTGGTQLARQMFWTSSTPAVEGKNPVIFYFSRLYEYSGGGSKMMPGHIWVKVCGKVFNAANYGVGITSLMSTAPLMRRVPRGLESLTMASCSKACSPGCTPETCDFKGSPGSGSGSNGCQTFAEYLDKMWSEDMLPAMMDMAAQLYAYRVFETRQLGMMIDAQNFNRTVRVIQEQRITAVQNNQPNELTCVAGSFGSSIAEASRTVNALTQGFKTDLGLRAQNATLANPSGPGPADDVRIRWAEYCNEFHDPAANNGVSTCPNPTIPGPAINEDISIEGFLLRDTINMNDEHEYKASQALLKNLIQPFIRPKIPENAIETLTGKEYILRQQHIDSASNIARDVIASIMSRRASMSPTTPNPVGPMIRDIRLKAGVDPSRIAENPSYNEIMLALTKERFFDPEYFARMENNIGAIKQEQTAVDNYITIELQDIYRLQEQINALLAARASLKIETSTNDSLNALAPK